MNGRERVLAALRHQEPDRVPIDLGGTDATGIVGLAYGNLREHLGLPRGKPRIFVPTLGLALVEPDVWLRLNSGDARAVFFAPQRWREDVMRDGHPCLVPERWQPTRLPDGSDVVYNDAGQVTLRRPPGGLYYDTVHTPLADVETVADLDRHAASFERFDWPAYADQPLEAMAAHAKALRDRGDVVVVGSFVGHIFAGAQTLRGFEQFMADLLIDPALAEAILDRLTEAHIARFARYAETVGPYLDVVQLSDDLGAQGGPQISPDLYRRMVKPYHSQLFRFIKEETGAYVFLHSCGSVYALIPDLIEAGVDILNPVQVSARDMDTARLKREFGRDLAFWGGGCDTQRVLPHGTPAQVRDEVRRRLDDLAPGGGFVFAQVHNIQADVPPENIVAMAEAVRAFGAY